MTNLLRILILTIIICSSSNRLMAQWSQTNGPIGGKTHGFESIGKNLFAATDGGVFLSSDNGTSWTPVNNGLWTQTVISITAIETAFCGGGFCFSFG